MADTNVVQKDLGPVSAYAIAVKHGYKGTEEEWAALQIASAENAKAADASAKEAAETLAAVHETVEQETTAAVAAVNNQETTSVQAVQDAAQAAAAYQEERIAVKGEQTLASIPDDYTKLGQDVAALTEEIDELNDAVGIPAAFAGSEEFVSIPHEIESGKTYKVNITTGTMRLFTKATADGAIIEYIIGTEDESTAKSAPFTTEFTATADASYLRVAAKSGQSYAFNIAIADGVCATLESVKEVTGKLTEIESVQNFVKRAGYTSYPATIEEGKTYLVHLKSGKVRLYTRATENGSNIDTIIGGTGAIGDITTKFTATADASYLRVAADTDVDFALIDCTTINGHLALIKYNGYNGIWNFQDSIYAPYPQLPANTSSESDFDAEDMKTQDIYDYLDALCEKYPQLLTKTVLGHDSSGELYVNRYVFADSAKSSYSATIYIGANEHGPTSDPRECAIVTARFIKDLCAGHAKTDAFLSAIKDNCKVVVIPVINPWGFDNNSRNNYNNVNINRNYPTPGWSAQADIDKGASAGSEIETQYVVDTISAFSPDIALDLHCLGYVVSDNDMTCAYSGQIKDHTKIENIVNSMRRDYNLNCVSYGQGDYTTNGNGDSYFRYLGIDGILLEFQSRDGLTSGSSVLHSANIMEANYTYLLRILNMLFYNIGA